MESYQISETISLPIRGDNILRPGFQPFKLNQDDLLSGLEDGQNLNGGKRIVKKKGVNAKFYFCKHNEGYGFDKTKTPKSSDLYMKSLIGFIQLVVRVNIAQGSLVILENTWWGCIASPSQIMPFCVHIVLKHFWTKVVHEHT